jgi:2-polyprenyl-6-methoxyphenol hydroxylase-like FAD-dependent oxidoreductase
VIIVGARVAGAVAAALLGEAGRRVLLLDRSRFPSDTLSTHFFRAPALRAFAQMGAYDEVQAAAPHLKVNFNVIDGVVFPEPVDRPEDYPFYMCVRRITLDDILIRRVSEIPNIELVQGAKASALLHKDGRVTGLVYEDGEGKKEARAKVVIGADGVRSFIAKQVNPGSEHEEPVNRAMYYAYYRGMAHNDGPAAEFHYHGNMLGYVMPTDDDLTLMAISAPIEEFAAFKRDPEGKLHAELEAMSEIAPRLQKAKREGPVRGSGSIPGYLRVPYGPGWALVGDAGMVMDPWSGQGIDQAATSAVFLAEYLNEFLAGDRDWESAMAAYHLARNEFSEKTYRRTSTFSKDLRPMTKAALEKRGL